MIGGKKDNGNEKRIEGRADDDDSGGGRRRRAAAGSRQQQQQKQQQQEDKSRYKKHLFNYVMCVYFVCACLFLCRSHWRERHLVVVVVLVARESFLTRACELAQGSNPRMRAYC